MNPPSTGYVYSQDAHQVELEITDGPLSAYPGQGWYMPASGKLVGSASLVAYLKQQNFSILVHAYKLPPNIGSTLENAIGAGLSNAKNTGYQCLVLDMTASGVAVYNSIFGCVTTDLKLQGSADARHLHGVNTYDVSVGYPRHRNLEGVNIIERGREVVSYNVAPFDQSGDIDYDGETLAVFIDGGILRSVAIFNNPMGVERLCDIDRMIWRAG